MKAIYIYNPHNAAEVALIERARQELGQHIDDVLVVDFMDAKQFHIAQTPALILIREDLQGPNLLTEDEQGQLRVTAELWQAIQQEEKVLHDAETHRIDNVIQAEVKPVKELASQLGRDLIQAKLKAKKAGVTL